MSGAFGAGGVNLSLWRYRKTGSDLMAGPGVAPAGLYAGGRMVSAQEGGQVSTLDRKNCFGRFWKSPYQTNGVSFLQTTKIIVLTAPIVMVMPFLHTGCQRAPLLPETEEPMITIEFIT